MDVARLVSGLALLAMGVVPGVLLDQIDSDVANAAVSYLVLGACLALLVGTARASAERALSTFTLIAAGGASLLWALWSVAATLRLMAN